MRKIYSLFLADPRDLSVKLLAMEMTQSLLAREPDDEGMKMTMENGLQILSIKNAGELGSLTNCLHKVVLPNFQVGP
jgi:hypothetical protein